MATAWEGETRALPTRRDDFEAWFGARMPELAPHPLVETLRVLPSHFERVYDLVDECFGVRRPRALYDWLYRRNPSGPARCWIAYARQGRHPVSVAMRFPWPLALGDEPLCGMLAGDVGVAPDWRQRQIGRARRQTIQSHPFARDETLFGWPNGKSVRRHRTLGWQNEIIGPLHELAAELPRLGSLVERLRRARGDALRIEPVARFDSAFDAVTERCAAWDGYWSPHDAAFLNWRYLDHPTATYRALALLEGEALRGYAVLSEDAGSARLMEFAAPCEGPAAVVLARAVVHAARAAGAHRLRFHATPAWPLWPGLCAAMHSEPKPGRMLFVERAADPDVARLERWCLVPGDCDAW